MLHSIEDSMSFAGKKKKPRLVQRWWWCLLLGKESDLDDKCLLNCQAHLEAASYSTAAAHDLHICPGPVQHAVIHSPPRWLSEANETPPAEPGFYNLSLDDLWTSRVPLLLKEHYASCTSWNTANGNRPIYPKNRKDCRFISQHLNCLQNWISKTHGW